MAKARTKAQKEETTPLQALEQAFAELGELLGTVRAYVDPEAQVPSEAFMAQTARLVLRLRGVVNTLSRPRDELTELLRDYVKANPTGWIRAATVEKNFLCWIAADGTLKVILVDSPTHELPVDDLLALVGLKQALPFFGVDYTAVCKAAAGGTLKNARNKVVPLENILERRVRKPRAKRVDIDSLDPDDVAPLVAVIDPEIARQRLEDLESLGLSAATVTALGNNGIETAWQLSHLSGEEIAALDGIGPVRAGEIMAAIVKRAR